MSENAVIVVPMNLAGVDVLVQAAQVVVVGTEPTSATKKVLEAYEKAEQAIIGLGTSVAETIGKMKRAGSQPKQVELAFGLSFTTEGNVWVVKGGMEATLSVTLTYEVGGQPK